MAELVPARRERLTLNLSLKKVFSQARNPARPRVMSGIMGKSLTGRTFLAAVILLLIVFSVTFQKFVQVPDSSLERILEKGVIVMITQNSSNTYYIHRDQPMGFEYDLAREFARTLGVELKVETTTWLNMFKMLLTRRGDFIAAGVTAVPSRESFVDFSRPYETIRQRLVLKEDHFLVQSYEDLNGMSIYVRAGTTYQERLTELKREGIGLDLVVLPDVLTEDLIQKVAQGEIEATVADSNIALLNRRYFPGIRIGMAISEDQPLAWAVRKGDLTLLEAINSFIIKAQADGTLARIMRFYHDDRNRMNELDIEAFHLSVREDFPLYESQIKAVAKSYGFDWRLITAMIYQESHFNPKARSHTGVKGLMQVTLDTAREMGIENRLDPEQSLKAGVRYLNSLWERFSDIEDSRKRIPLVLAAYNVGFGHVQDARKIARIKGLDPSSWASLRQTLPLLSRPEYYRFTTYGYARGTEPVRYVTNVLTYFDILIKKMKSVPGPAAGEAPLQERVN